MTQDPTPRLRTDPGASERLRRDLEHARTHTVDFDLEAGLRELGATLDRLEGGADLSSSGGGAPWAAHVRSVAAKWWAWSLMSAALLSFVWWTQSHSSGSSAPRPFPLERSATQEARAPSSTTLGPSEESATNSAADRAKAERAPDAAPEGSERARDARSRPWASSAAARGGEDSARRHRGSLDRAKSASNLSHDVSRSGARSGSETAVAHPSSAAQAAGRVPTTGGSADGTTQVPSGSSSDGERAGRGVGTAPSPVVALADASAAIAAATPTSLRETEPAGSEGEVEHLAQVRRLLKREPARALEAARAGQSTFAGGLFHEERAALIVFALARLNRAQEALREAQRYLRAYPRGPFAQPVREITTRFEDTKP